MSERYSAGIRDRRVEVVYSADATAADHLGAVAEVAALLSLAPGLGVLVDRTARVGLLSGAEERSIVAALTAAPTLAGAPIALLTRPGAQYGVARIQQAIAEGMGVRMEVFTERAEAIAWLQLNADG